MKIRFIHPHRADQMAADVDPRCTGKNVIRGLIDVKFLDRSRRLESYVLVPHRTGAPLDPNATLASYDLQDNDLIQVL